MNPDSRLPLPGARTAHWRRLGLALMLAGAAAAAHGQPSRATQLYEDALKRYERRDFAGAAVQLKNALQIDRKQLSVQLLLGKALLANSEVAAAEVAFNEAIALGVNRAEVVVPLARSVVEQGKPARLFAEPTFAVEGLPSGIQGELLLVRAGASADLGDSAAALKAIEQARAIDPQGAESWAAEVPVRIRARQFKEAQAAAERAAKADPGSAEALYLLGSIAHAQGNAAAAVPHYDRALALRADHQEALVSRAGALLDLNRVDEALRDVETLRKKHPREPRGAYLRALIAQRQGDAVAARGALNDVTSLLDPVPVEFLRYRSQILMLGGLAHFDLGQLEKARPYLEMAQRAQGTTAVSKLLAQIYLADKNHDRAIETLEGYVKARPRDAQAQALLASAHMAQGRHARATQILQDALKLQDSPELRATLGTTLARSNRVGEAVTEFETLWRKDPSRTAVGASLASLYLRGGQAAKAVGVAESITKREPKNAGFHNLLGMARLAAGNAAGARTAFEEASRIDPRFAQAQINLARLDARAGNAQAAAQRLDAVLKLDDRNIEALMQLAALDERRGRVEDATRGFTKAADLSAADDVGPGVELVSFHLRGGRSAEALEAVRKLQTKAPESLPVLLTSARAQLAAGQAEPARASLARATKVAGFDADRQLEIALLQVAVGNLAGAAYSVDKALNVRPDLLTAQALMVDIELRQGEVAKAEQRARQIAARQPKAAISHTLLGDVALTRGQRPAALESYRRAFQIEPSQEHLLRVFSVQAASDPGGAVATAEQWLRSHPGDPVVRRVIGDAHARAGNLPAARAAYEAQLKTRPDDAETLNNLAQVLLMAKDPTAQRVAERALSRSPQAPHIMGTAGWAAFQAGQKDRALQLLREARLRDPNNAETRYYLAAVLADTGRRTEAREELQTALRGNRNFASAAQAEALLATLK